MKTARKTAIQLCRCESGIGRLFKLIADEPAHAACTLRLVDFARQVVGIGSVGMPCWIFYLEGSSERDPLFLQFKGAGLSVLTPYVKRSLFKNQGNASLLGSISYKVRRICFLGMDVCSRGDGKSIIMSGSCAT